MAPIKLQIVVIYHPPGQILAPSLEELDGLLSSFMENGTPLLVFGDFNIHLEKPYATDFHSLLASLDLKRLTTTSTQKSGKQLDLIYTRDCTADNILVQPLHISDHFFIKFTLYFATRCHVKYTRMQVIALFIRKKHSSPNIADCRRVVTRVLNSPA